MVVVLTTSASLSMKVHTALLITSLEKTMEIVDQANVLQCQLDVTDKDYTFLAARKMITESLTTFGALTLPITNGAKLTSHRLSTSQLPAVVTQL